MNGARDAAEGICDNPDIKAVAFVGSTKAVKIVYERSAKTGQRVLCLGGAKITLSSFLTLILTSRPVTSRPQPSDALDSVAWPPRSWWPSGTLITSSRAWWITPTK